MYYNSFDGTTSLEVNSNETNPEPQLKKFQSYLFVGCFIIFFLMFFFWINLFGYHHVESIEMNGIPNVSSENLVIQRFSISQIGQSQFSFTISHWGGETLIWSKNFRLCRNFSSSHEFQMKESSRLEIDWVQHAQDIRQPTLKRYFSVQITLNTSVLET